MNKTMNLTLKVWRQQGHEKKGKLETFHARDISTDMSFLEMLDVVNESLVLDDKDPIAFDHDCREGICGTCGAMVNGHPHGPESGTTLCQLHMRHFKDGDVIVIEPWRSKAFRVIRDLMTDRSALDTLIQAGGYVSVSTGGVPDGNAVAVSPDSAERAMDAAECIGCGACIAACPNASATLFVSAKISQLALLPQGRPEAAKRVKAMVQKMGDLGFGNCSNHRDCEFQCPKNISIQNIARMNREFIKAKLTD